MNTYKKWKDYDKKNQDKLKAPVSKTDQALPKQERHDKETPIFSQAMDTKSIRKRRNPEKELIMKRIFYSRHKWSKMRIMRNSDEMKCVLSLL